MSDMGDQSRTFTSMSQFLDECRRIMRYRHLSYHTEKSYLDWIERFVRHFKRIKPHVCISLKMNTHFGRR